MFLQELSKSQINKYNIMKNPATQIVPKDKIITDYVKVLSWRADKRRFINKNYNTSKFNIRDDPNYTFVGLIPYPYIDSETYIEVYRHNDLKLWISYVQLPLYHIRVDYSKPIPLNEFTLEYGFILMGKEKYLVFNGISEEWKFMGTNRQLKNPVLNQNLKYFQLTTKLEKCIGWFPIQAEDNQTLFKIFEEGF